MFVLEDTDARTLRRHLARSSPSTGGPGTPYFWLEVTTEERRSPELGERFVHKKLQLRSTEDGPTEIGGLILDPAYRRHHAALRQGALDRALRVHRRCTRSASSAR